MYIACISVCILVNSNIIGKKQTCYPKKMERFRINNNQEIKFNSINFDTKGERSQYSAFSLSFKITCATFLLGNYIHHTLFI